MFKLFVFAAILAIAAAGAVVPAFTSYAAAPAVAYSGYASPYAYSAYSGAYSPYAYSAYSGAYPHAYSGYSGYTGNYGYAGYPYARYY